MSDTETPIAIEPPTSLEELYQSFAFGGEVGRAVASLGPFVGELYVTDDEEAREKLAIMLDAAISTISGWFNDLYGRTEEAEVRIVELIEAELDDFEIHIED